MDHPFVISLLLACGLLLAGVVLRATLRPLRAMFIPASVVGGLIGLAIMQAGLRAGEGEPTRRDGDVAFTYFADPLLERLVGGIPANPNVESGEIDLQVVGGDARRNEPPSQSQAWAAELSNTLDGWPSWLIAVVFAGLLIDKPTKRFGEALTRAARAGVVAWIIILGQVFLGLLACALLIAPFYDVPRPFGQLIEVGMAGGFGTAGAMGEVFRLNYDFPEGRDLGLLFATVGLLYGTLSGIVLINIGVRRGWLRPGAGERLSADAAARHLRVDSAPIGLARVRGEIIDPLAFQLCLLAAAFGVGYAMQQAFLFGIDLVADDRTMGFIGTIPLFLFTLLGGWLVREAMHLVGVGDLIDARSINRLVGIAMELLIVAALVTLRIESATEYLWPVVLLLVVGCAWCAISLAWICRALLPKEYWFELGLINYGMATATTAQGMLLLRIVDPDLESGAAEDYAAAAPLSSPFIGGGVLTVLGIPLALNAVGYWPVIAVLGVVLVGLYVLGRVLKRADEARTEPRGFEVI